MIPKASSNGEVPGGAVPRQREKHQMTRYRQFCIWRQFLSRSSGLITCFSTIRWTLQQSGEQHNHNNNYNSCTHAYKQMDAQNSILHPSRYVCLVQVSNLPPRAFRPHQSLYREKRRSREPSELANNASTQRGHDHGRRRHDKDTKTTRHEETTVPRRWHDDTTIKR